MLVETRKTSKITVKDRIRQDLGDLAPLMESLKERGLINPITIRADGTLIAGERRLEAARRLGWQEIEVHVWRSQADTEELFYVEREENTCRKALKPTEAELMWDRYRDLVRANGAGEMGRGDKNRSLKYVPGAAVEGAVEKLAAEALGSSARTLRRVREVREAAEDKTQPAEVREVAKEQYKALDEGKTKARPAAEAVQIAKRRGQNLKEARERRNAEARKNLLPGQWLKSDEPKAPPKPTDWNTRLWEVIRTGTLIGKTAEELEVSNDTSDLTPEVLQDMMNTIQEKIRNWEQLKKVLRQLKKEKT